MPNGYNGKVLRVDLSNGRVWTEEVEPITYRRYLGGSGLALYFLLNELPRGVAPLSPDNILVFTASVITGTPLSGASRFTAAARSPLTGAYGESEAGGWWGPELKKAGFDAVVIYGKAPKPVYLWIHDGEAELRDASAIWGEFTGPAQQAIREELGDRRIRVAQIGPGGENRVRYACIVNELHHFNGRTGMGAVMGSKNLKALAVRGTSKVSIHDHDTVRDVLRWLKENYERRPMDMHDGGTARIVPMLNNDGILPTRNFHEGAFEHADDISGKRMIETILIDRGTCYACAIQCKRVVKVDEGPYKVDPMYGGPEYETVASLGSLCGVGDLNAIAMGNQLCGQYTLDTISTGVSIAFAMECYENGLLSKEDTGDLDLRFGNAEAMVRLVEMIGKREGLGDLLAEGVKRAAAQIGGGAEQYAQHVKGQEVPMHEPRGKKGLALAYATSPTGADHMEAPHDPFYAGFHPESVGGFGPLGLIESLDPLDTGPEKVRAFYYTQQVFNLYNAIGLCDFVGIPLGPFPLDQLVRYVKAVTGWDTSLWELLKAGERSANMARVFNVREGFSPKDDRLPDRLHRELEGGALKGERITPEEFERMLQLYYGMAGWDSKIGAPTEAKLTELDLLWTVEG